MIASTVSATTVLVPWGCWYGDEAMPLEFPREFRVTVHQMKGAPALSAAAMRTAIERPIGVARLRELARSSFSVAIAVDDISRPTPVGDVLPLLLQEVAAIPARNVKIIVALGAHRPMLRHELVAKLGALAVRELDIEQHHPYENLVDLGVSSRGIPVRLNKTFYEADLKIGVGCVLPHPYMGFGGGAKIVVPGLAGIETLQANHQPAVTGISGGLCNPDVDARQQVEEIALNAGLAFSCNVVVNEQRRIAGLFCGHPVTAHRHAVGFSREIYATPVNGARHDIICLNAYPKDTELLQVGNALNCYRTAGAPPLKPGGTVLITACCSTGRGYHSLHGKGMRLYRPPGRKEYLGDHDVVVYSPNLSPRDFPVSFWPDYRFFRSWSDVTAHLSRRHPGASVGVFPTAPLQILD